MQYINHMTNKNDYLEENITIKYLKERISKTKLSRKWRSNTQLPKG